MSLRARCLITLGLIQITNLPRCSCSSSSRLACSFQNMLVYVLSFE